MHVIVDLVVENWWDYLSVSEWDASREGHLIAGFHETPEFLTAVK